MAQWLEHQTSMGRSNGVGLSLGYAFFSHTFFFIILLSKKTVIYYWNNVSIVNDGSVELSFTLVCCWIRSHHEKLCLATQSNEKLKFRIFSFSARKLTQATPWRIFLNRYVDSCASWWWWWWYAFTFSMHQNGWRYYLLKARYPKLTKCINSYYMPEDLKTPDGPLLVFFI